MHCYINSPFIISHTISCLVHICLTLKQTNSFLIDMKEELRMRTFCSKLIFSSSHSLIHWSEFATYQAQTDQHVNIYFKIFEFLWKFWGGLVFFHLPIVLKSDSKNNYCFQIISEIADLTILWNTSCASRRCPWFLLSALSHCLVMFTLSSLSLSLSLSLFLSFYLSQSHSLSLSLSQFIIDILYILFRISVQFIFITFALTHSLSLSLSLSHSLSLYSSLPL
jgi:hypothetical protein